MKTDVVFLMDVSQHKWVGVFDSDMVWSDDYITVKTADNANTSLVEVGCSTENHMISPGAIFFHPSYVILPGRITMDKVKQICSIRLCEEKW